MAQRADLYLAQSSGLLQFSGGGSNYIVKTAAGNLYAVYADNANDVAFRKSTDGGLTWSASTIVFAGTLVSISVWYDRWSNISAGLIHIAYTESGNTTRYRTIDTESSDALSTETTIFTGVSTAGGGHLSITRARGGNVYCKTCIDAGAEGGFFRLPNANVPNGAWDVARTNNEALATQDQMLLVPGFAADNQDIMGIWWDASANQCSTYVYDDSANTWAESIWTGTFTDTPASTSFPHFAVAVDLTNSKIIAIAWNAIDAANADLTCWSIDESANTALTDVVTNSTDDQHLAAIAIDTGTGYWWAFYCGKSDGSETVGTSVNLYCKVSRDSGTTWGSETLLSSTGRPVKWLATIPRGTAPFVAAFHCDEASGTRDLRMNTQVVQPRASSLVGI